MSFLKYKGRDAKPDCVTFGIFGKLSVYVKQFRTKPDTQLAFSKCWPSFLRHDLAAVSSVPSSPPRLSFGFQPAIPSVLFYESGQGIGQGLLRVRRNHICSSAFASGRIQASQLQVICVTVRESHQPSCPRFAFHAMNIVCLRFLWAQ